MLLHKSGKEENELNDVLNKNNKKSGKLTPMLLNKDRSKLSSRQNEYDSSNVKIKQNESKPSHKISQKEKTSSVSENTSTLPKSENKKEENSLLDDPKFRRSFIKKEKIEIDCSSSMNNSVMSKSMINFDDDYAELESKQTEEKFNQMVRDQLFSEYFEVNEFLESLNLIKYNETFIKNGIVTLDKIYNELNEEKLKEIKIPYGHRVKIMKKIKNSFLSNTTQTENKTNKNNFSETSQEHEVNDIYHEIEAGNNPNRNELEELEYNEKEQRRLFQLAVEEFRRGNSEMIRPEETAENKHTGQKASNINYKLNSNNTTFIDNQNIAGTSRNTTSFLYNIGENNFDFNNIHLFENNGNDVQVDNNQDVNIKNFLPILKSKTLCWSCYKIILSESALFYTFEQKNEDKNIIRKDINCQDENKIFCSKICLDKYKEELIINCDDKDCKTLLPKTKSLFYRSFKFCSESCLLKNKTVENNYERQLSSTVTDTPKIISNKIETYQAKEKIYTELNEIKNDLDLIQYDPMCDF